MFDQQLLQKEITINSEQTNQDNELLHEQTGAEVTQPLLPHADDSIADRFVRLMPALPEISDQLNFMTIITPEGLFQLSQETNMLKCLLNTDQLEQLGLSDFVEYSERSMPEAGTLIYDALTINSFTLEQLRMLERTVIGMGGRSVLGYTNNEKVILKLLNGFYDNYPPPLNNYA